MSDTPPIGHNRAPTLAELVAPNVIDTFIAAELDREPEAPDGNKVKSIRARDAELEAMCRRFLATHPVINDDATQSVATEVLSTCLKFAGGTGRIEVARKALKQPVWDAGIAIDLEFGRFGSQLVIRPPTGPANKRRQAPYTLAEQIQMVMATYADKVAADRRRAAQDEADKKRAEAEALEQVAARGSGLVTYEDAAIAQAAADKAQSRASAPMADLTRTHGGDFGVSSGKRVRTFRVVNPALVPRNLCVPSEPLIRAAMGAADSPMPDIPGVEIEDITEMVRR